MRMTARCTLIARCLVQTVRTADLQLCYLTGMSAGCPWCSCKVCLAAEQTCIFLESGQPAFVSMLDCFAAADRCAEFMLAVAALCRLTGSDGPSWPPQPGGAEVVARLAPSLPTTAHSGTSLQAGRTPHHSTSEARAVAAAPQHARLCTMANYRILARACTGCAGGSLSG